MGKKRSYKANRAPQARSIKQRYEVYLRWYEHYAKNNEMAVEPLNLFGYKNELRRAEYMGYAKENLSRQIAMRQRLSSEKQLRVTWETVKKQIPEFRKNLELSKEQIQRRVLAEYVSGKKDLDFTQIEKYVQRWGDKDIPAQVKKQASQYFEREMADEISFLEEYGDIKFTQFRKQQKAVLNAARSIVTEKQGRDVWNEAFAGAVSVVYRK